MSRDPRPATTPPAGGATFTAAERRAIEAAREARTTDAWRALPVVPCACGQHFYREHARQTCCRDCMGDTGFYPVPGWAAR